VQNVTKFACGAIKMPKPDDSNWAKFASLGLEVAAGVGIGAAVGYWIDRRLHSDPWGILIGSMLGMASGMYLLIKGVINANKDR
jgi:F0F1-type ATP synthase assembly protein I